MNKHLVTYMGSGLWRDSEEKLWGEVEGRTDITRKVVFKSTKSQEDFLETRPDIKFMIEYGQMSIETLSADDAEDKVLGGQIVESENKESKEKRSAGISITPQ